MQVTIFKRAIVCLYTVKWFQVLLSNTYIYIYIYIYINRIWHKITYMGWYAIKHNQPANLYPFAILLSRDWLPYYLLVISRHFLVFTIRLCGHFLINFSRFFPICYSTFCHRLSINITSTAVKPSLIKPASKPPASALRSWPPLPIRFPRVICLWSLGFSEWSAKPPLTWRLILFFSFDSGHHLWWPSLFTKCISLSLSLSQASILPLPPFPYLSISLLIYLYQENIHLWTQEVRYFKFHVWFRNITGKNLNILFKVTYSVLNFIFFCVLYMLCSSYIEHFLDRFCFYLFII